MEPLTNRCFSQLNQRKEQGFTAASRTPSWLPSGQEYPNQHPCKPQENPCKPQARDCEQISIRALRGFRIQGIRTSRAQMRQRSCRVYTCCRLEGFETEDCRTFTNLLLAATDDRQILRVVLVVRSQTGFEGFDKLVGDVPQPNHVCFTENKRGFFVGNDWRSFPRKTDILGPEVLQQ